MALKRAFGVCKMMLYKKRLQGELFFSFSPIDLAENTIDDR